MKYTESNRYPKESLDSAGVASDLPPSNRKYEAPLATPPETSVTAPGAEVKLGGQGDDAANVMLTEEERAEAPQQRERTKAAANEPV